MWIWIIIIAVVIGALLDILIQESLKVLLKVLLVAQWQEDVWRLVVWQG